jgi:predicted enzyme related to lactoylglutathione lyase
MSSSILNVTFDCHDARLVAEFWGAVTGYPPTQVRDPENEYWVAAPPERRRPRLVFVTVPETKAVKNRVHLDLLPDESGQAHEVDRLLQLGATVVDDRRDLQPGGWIVLADPEGNEFCVE